MIKSGKRGFVLVPVAIALAVTGALAWAMVREGAMNVSEVGTAYDDQVARYLAEAGMNLARWQNQQIKCGNAVAFGNFSLPGGTVTTNDVHAVSGGLSIDVSATTPGGGIARRTNTAVPVYDHSARAETIISGKTLTDDTTLTLGKTTTQGNDSSLEFIDGTERGAIKYVLTSVQNVLVVAASFQIMAAGGLSATVTQVMSAHRATTTWAETTATWVVPWHTAGGDFIDQPAGSMTLGKTQNTYYSMRLDALVDAWIKQAVPNNGVVLTSSGMNKTRFSTSEDAGHPPKLVIDYYPRCK